MQRLPLHVSMLGSDQQLHQFIVFFFFFFTYTHVHIYPFSSFLNARFVQPYKLELISVF